MTILKLTSRVCILELTSWVCGTHQSVSERETTAWSQIGVTKFMIQDRNYRFVKLLAYGTDLKPLDFSTGIGAAFSFEWTELYDSCLENNFCNLKLQLL